MGLGSLISNPITGKIMVLGIRGRRTGKMRYTPVSWYLNILAHPQVEVLLPQGRFTGRAEEVGEGPERLEAMRLLLQGSGLSRSMYGFDPATASDDLLAEKTRGIPVIGIRVD
ncbi:MAG: nitroreductase family deazaflavin-dependent oxidoreductase [Methanothrix sp.]|nr:nitroreductase family deazaflavin-dependent oxidoreductase [Methanothrix sp.]